MQGVHVAVGRSALALLRSVRVGERSEAGFLLAGVDVEARRAWLPSQMPTGEDAAPSSAATSAWDIESLEDADFPFEAVTSNRKIPAWRRDALAPITPQDPLELGIFDES